MIDATTLNRGDAFVIASHPDGQGEWDGLAVRFSSVVGGTDGQEVCVQADLIDLANRCLSDFCDDGGGFSVPTDWLVPA